MKNTYQLFHLPEDGSLVTGQNIHDRRLTGCNSSESELHGPDNP